MERECTNCEYLTDDNCWPSIIMLCGHPIFDGCNDYRNAIVQWRYFNPRRVVSDICPLENPN